jgi:hypothetical protein
LLYLSASAIFSSVHHHSDDALSGDMQCAACAWHIQSATDVPIVAILPAPPVAIAVQLKLAHISSKPRNMEAVSNRGPPSFTV